MIAWRMAAQFESWNVSSSHLLVLPSVDVSGNIYFCDGYALYGYDDVGDPVGKKIVMFPVTGPLFDMTIVSNQFLYLLYKSGFMVAFFTGTLQILETFCGLVIIMFVLRSKWSKL